MATKKDVPLEDQEVVVSNGLKFSKLIVWLMYIWVLIGVISLTLRVLLLALSANMSAGFANFVLEVSGDYLEPFRGMFPGKDLSDTGYLDVSAIFAIIVYLFVLWGFHSLINYVQNKIDLDKELQASKISEAKRMAELARQEELERQAQANLQEVLNAPVKKQVTTKTTTRVVQ